MNEKHEYNSNVGLKNNNIVIRTHPNMNTTKQ